MTSVTQNSTTHTTSKHTASTHATAATRPRAAYYVGLDVHKDSITIAAAPAFSGRDPEARVIELGRIPHDYASLQRKLARLQRPGEDDRLRRRPHLDRDEHPTPTTSDTAHTQPHNSRKEDTGRLG